MQVILKEKIRRLGSLGQIVNVKPGYARNFLIPQGKALRATADNIKTFEAQKVELERAEAARFKSAESLLKQLEGLVLTITAKAGEGGKLFGSVGTRDLSEVLEQKGVQVGKHQIRLPEGVLRQVGEYDIQVHLHSDLDASVKVVIVAA